MYSWNDRNMSHQDTQTTQKTYFYVCLELILEKIKQRMTE